jgi:glycosyltransferase involved in cell wall biosynthesis
LSRLHPKKGLGILIEAFSKIENKKIKLKIAGTENKYSDSIKVRCKELNISDRVEFLGGVYGDEKYQLFANAKAFVSPSYSEAIGMVNLEAASSNTPVITSFNTGINPEWGKNGGVMIVPDIVELTNAMNEVCSWNNEERIQRGLLLSEYVLKNYSWEKKGILWDELYNSIS